MVTHLENIRRRMNLYFYSCFSPLKIVLIFNYEASQSFQKKTKNDLRETPKNPPPRVNMLLNLLHTFFPLRNKIHPKASHSPPHSSLSISEATTRMHVIKWTLLYTFLNMCSQIQGKGWSWPRLWIMSALSSNSAPAPLVAVCGLWQIAQPLGSPSPLL